MNAQQEAGSVPTNPAAGNLLGYAGQVRYSDHHHGVKIEVEGWFSLPSDWDDYDDEDQRVELREKLLDLIVHRNHNDPVLVANQMGSSPDSRNEARVVDLDEGPGYDREAWVLMVEDDEDLTVIEFATKEPAVAAFWHHVQVREQPGSPYGMYDFVVNDPSVRRTAVPPRD